MSVHICGGALGGDPLEEIRREPHGEERWCFKCRAKRQFEFVVLRPVDWMNSYYGPSAQVECATCHTVDGDCFPGTQREWED